MKLIDKVDWIIDYIIKKERCEKLKMNYNYEYSEYNSRLDITQTITSVKIRENEYIRSLMELENHLRKINIEQ